MVGEERELGHAALSEQATEDHLAMARGSGPKERPDMGDDLLVLLRQALDILLKLIQLNLICGSLRSQVGAMAVAKAFLGLGSPMVGGGLFRPGESWEGGGEEVRLGGLDGSQVLDGIRVEAERWSERVGRVGGRGRVVGHGAVKVCESKRGVRV